MKISVQHKPSFDFITVREKQDGIIVGCNHAGAEEEYLPAFRQDSDSHEYLDDDSELVLLCNKCDMQFIDGEWL